MSGGSYNYAYERIALLADEIQPSTPERRAFKAHLHKVARACQDIEWVDSCDYSKGEETAAILACLQPLDVVATALADLRAAIAEAVRVVEAEEAR